MYLQAHNTISHPCPVSPPAAMLQCFSWLLQWTHYLTLEYNVMSTVCTGRTRHSTKNLLLSETLWIPRYFLSTPNHLIWQVKKCFNVHDNLKFLPLIVIWRDYSHYMLYWIKELIFKQNLHTFHFYSQCYSWRATVYQFIF